MHDALIDFLAFAFDSHSHTGLIWFRNVVMKEVNGYYII